MRQLSTSLIVATALSIGIVLPAHAAFIDFDTHASTTSLSGVPPANTVVTTDYAAFGIVFGRTGVSAGSAVVNNSNTFSLPNGACGLDAAGSIVSICTGDQYFHFVNPSNGTDPATTGSLSFVVGDSGGDLDGWIFHIYDINDVELEARSVTSTANTLQSFSHAGMHRVWIEWTDITSGGYLLDNISFDTPTVAGVPVTGTVALVLAGFGIMGFIRRRTARAG
jgi:hypothetical protein